MVAASLSHSAIVNGDGTLFAVGSDDSGQLGQGRMVQSATPLRIAGPASIAKIVAVQHLVFLPSPSVDGFQNYFAAGTFKIKSSVGASASVSPTCNVCHIS